MTPTSQRVVAECIKWWPQYKSDCSGFAKAVAHALTVPLDGMANDIVDQLGQSPWRRLPSGVEAAQQASLGLVIGGLKAEGHGHVVIVVPGPLNRNKYPTAYWGRLGDVGSKNQTINWAWGPQTRDLVHYAWFPL